MPAPKVYNKHHGDAPRDAVYIGRGSPWGNRFVIGEHGDRDQVCDRFECEQLPDMDVRDLANKDLVCFCAPHRCHGDSILLKANHRVLVFGGRNFSDRRWLYEVLDAAHARRKITCIIKLTGCPENGLRAVVWTLIPTRLIGMTSSARALS